MVNQSSSQIGITPTSPENRKRWFLLIMLSLAGSTIYTFPFLRYSYYEPLQNALNVTHTQMGILQSLNGILSTLGYIPGGWLADRYSPRVMLTGALIGTGLSGFYFATFPSYIGAMFLYGFWGFSTLVIFWAPLMKATRGLGNKEEQGLMFGLLEGGRGIWGLLIGALTLTVFSQMGESQEGLKWVILISAVITLAAGISIWYLLGDIESEVPAGSALEGIVQAAKMPTTWIISIIIFCGYSLFAGQSYITPYMTQVLGASMTLGALMGLIRTYGLQTAGGISAALLSKKTGSPNKIVIYGFSVTSVCLLGFIVIPSSASMMSIVTINMLVLGFAIYIIRGNYYALIGESDMPLNIMGTIVGVSSFIGFMPEAFIYPLIGYWLDTYPGETGYRITFTYLFFISLLGLVMSVVLLKRNQRLSLYK
jgi:predicted MFS family arabinose efflux permease